jgi:hypothetical protein
MFFFYFCELNINFNKKTMTGKYLVKKASGEIQPFSSEKLENSLRRAGATEELIHEIITDIKSWLTDVTTTQKIYARAFLLLRRKKRSMAARYSLKRAIMELGPSGYPFEKFMGHIFRSKGLEVQTGQILNGRCVTHEVDVVATGEKEQHLVECKYYNSQGKYANVQVPLYIRSRVNDIVSIRETQPEYEGFTFHGWIATNTRFTGDAMSFGLCSGLKLISWDYPDGESIKAIIERENLFPITTLTQLTKIEKQQLLAKGVVLCKEIKTKPEVVSILNLKPAKYSRLMEEVTDLSVK